MDPRVVLVLSLTSLAAVSVALVVLTVCAKIVRERRTRALSRLAAPQRLLLLEVASGDDDGTATQMLAATAGRHWTSIRDSVVAMLSKVRGAPAQQLVSILHAHGDIERARADLGSRSAITRARGAYVLGLARDLSSVPALVERLADPVADVRFVSTRSLGQIGDPAAATAVLDAVRRRGGAVPAWVAAEAVLSMGPDVTPALLDALVSDDPDVRAVAVTVTAHSVQPAAVAILRERLNFETDPQIKTAMVDALGRLGGGADVPLLLGYTGRYAPAQLRRTTIAALGRLGDPIAAPRLRELLEDPDRASASAAAEALTGLGPVGTDILEAAHEQGREAARVASAALHLARLRADAPEMIR